MHIWFSVTGAIHVAMACTSLVLGLLVLSMRKGTPTHRAVGLCYAFAMVSVNGSALMTFDLNGRPGIFHALALISLAGVVYGVLAAIFRWKNWLYSHYRAMSMSYVGLLAALCGEALVRIPAIRHQIHGATSLFAAGIGIALLFTIAGRLLVRRLAPKALASVARN